MTITEDIREHVIKEYEEQKYREKCECWVKTKPIGRAQMYFRFLTETYMGLYSKSWIHEANETVKRVICNKYGLTMITQLKPEHYDEANEYAIQLFTKETEDRGYSKDFVVKLDVPWKRNRFGKLVKTKYEYTWDEWKKLCYDKVH